MSNERAAIAELWNKAEERFRIFAKFKHIPGTIRVGEILPVGTILYVLDVHHSKLEISELEIMEHKVYCGLPELDIEVEMRYKREGVYSVEKFLGSISHRDLAYYPDSDEVYYNVSGRRMFTSYEAAKSAAKEYVDSMNEQFKNLA